MAETPEKSYTPPFKGGSNALPQVGTIGADVCREDTLAQSLAWRMHDGIIRNVVGSWNTSEAVNRSLIANPQRSLLKWLRGLPEKGIPKVLTRHVVSELESLHRGDRSTSLAGDRSTSVPGNVQYREREESDARPLNDSASTALWLLRSLVHFRPEFNDVASWDAPLLQRRLPTLSSELDEKAPTLKHLGLTGHQLLNLTMAEMGEYPFRLPFEVKKLVMGLQSEVTAHGALKGEPRPLPTQMCSLLSSAMRGGQPDIVLLRLWLYQLTEALRTLPRIGPSEMVFRAARFGPSVDDREPIAPDGVASVFPLHAVIHWRQISAGTTSYHEASRALSKVRRARQPVLTCVLLTPRASEGPSALRAVSGFQSRARARSSLVAGRPRPATDSCSDAAEVLIPQDAHFNVADSVYDPLALAHLVVLRELVQPVVHQINPTLHILADVRAAAGQVLRSAGQDSAPADKWVRQIHDAVLVEEEQCYVVLDELGERLRQWLLVAGWLYANAHFAVSVSYSIAEEELRRASIVEAHAEACALVSQLQGAIQCPRLSPPKAAWLLSQLERATAAQLAAVCCGVLALDNRKCAQLVLAPAYHLVLQGLGSWRSDAVTVFYLLLVVRQAVARVGHDIPLVRQFSLYEATGICAAHPENAHLCLLYLQLWQELATSAGVSAAAISHAHLAQILEAHAEVRVLHECLAALRAVTRQKGQGAVLVSNQPQLVSWVVRRGLENTKHRGVLRRALQVIADIAAANDCAVKMHCYLGGAGSLATAVVGVCAPSADAELLCTALTLLSRLASSREVAWRLRAADGAAAAVDALVSRAEEELPLARGGCMWDAFRGPPFVSADGNVPSQEPPVRRVHALACRARKLLGRC
eukprot:Hpha_TRINITY_DN26756_c0_g1::TRINITY_DN26756_c0_g1_i1::g.138806::m.138806